MAPNIYANTTGISPGWTADPAYYEPLSNALKGSPQAQSVADLIKLQVEYAAMRTFLQVNHPDLLEQFDVAYAAQKRMGVGRGNNQTTSP